MPEIGTRAEREVQAGESWRGVGMACQTGVGVRGEAGVQVVASLV
jgi:hypothetical protein